MVRGEWWRGAVEAQGVVAAEQWEAFTARLIACLSAWGVDAPHPPWVGKVKSWRWLEVGYHLWLRPLEPTRGRQAAELCQLLPDGIELRDG